MNVVRTRIHSPLPAATGGSSSARPVGYMMIWYVEKKSLFCFVWLTLLRLGMQSKPQSGDCCFHALHMFFSEQRAIISPNSIGLYTESTVCKPRAFLWYWRCSHYLQHRADCCHGAQQRLGWTAVLVDRMAATNRTEDARLIRPGGGPQQPGGPTEP